MSLSLEGIIVVFFYYCCCGGLEKSVYKLSVPILLVWEPQIFDLGRIRVAMRLNDKRVVNVGLVAAPRCAPYRNLALGNLIEGVGF
jgi:hypothetical protein